MAALIGYLVFLCAIASVHLSYPSESEETKQKLAKYIKEKKPSINQRYRLHYHAMPPVGWMNDPNGFSYYKGQFHVFYQYYPYDTLPGPMHWGHSVSPNLIDWEALPTALAPDEEQCFSGSGVVDGNKLVLMYTAHIVNKQDQSYNETQYLASSTDGVNFYKYDGNPVLTDAPDGTADFRDPKVWKHGDHWYVVLGSKTTNGLGRVLLYRSKDLHKWDFLSVIGESRGELGYMWECPDFFKLDGKYVLLMSPQGLEPQGDRYKNVFQTGYIIGDFNYETFEFVPQVDFQEIDFGHDFYATQTIEFDGKRIVLAWFDMWEVPHPEDVDGWVGALTIARELRLSGDRILMKPLDGMLSLRNGLLHNGPVKKNEFLVFGKTGELIISGDLAKKIELQIEGTDGGNKTWIRWDPQSGKVAVDRNGDVRQVEWSRIGSSSWRLFLDASSLELFCGEGEVVFSTRIYPEGNLKVTNLSDQSLNIEAHKLRKVISNASSRNSAALVFLIIVLFVNCSKIMLVL